MSPFRDYEFGYRLSGPAYPALMMMLIPLDLDSQQLHIMRIKRRGCIISSQNTIESREGNKRFA
jgi:hypothetical protein